MKISYKGSLVAILVASLGAFACAVLPSSSRQNLNEENVAAIVEETIQASQSNDGQDEAPTAQNPDHLYCRFCLGGELWDVTVSPPAQFEAPVEIGDFYDWAPNTGKVLFADHFPDSGAGPGNKAVSNLFALDIASGQTETIIAESLVVNARWAENGEDFAYLLATPDTYELRVRRANGEDVLAAEGVNLIYAFRPDGGAIAFERKLHNDPGIDTSLHLYDFATGTETKIAEMDRSGGGSIYDEMLWAPDGGGFAIPFISAGTDFDEGEGYAYVNVADGSVTKIALAANLQAGDDSPLYTDVFSFWHPDGSSIVGVRCGDCFQFPENPTSQVVLFHLDDARTAITAISVVYESEAYKTPEVLTWQQPGQSIWVIPPGDFESQTQPPPFTLELP